MNCLVFGTEDNYPSPTQRTELEPEGTAELEMKQCHVETEDIVPCFQKDLIEFPAILKCYRGCRVPVTYKQYVRRVILDSISQLTV